LLVACGVAVADGDAVLGRERRDRRVRTGRRRRGVAEAQVGGVDDADDVAGERLVEHRTGDFMARRVGRRDWGHDGPVHDFGGKGGGSMTHR
jgi:hypothetical protein